MPIPPGNPDAPRVIDKFLEQQDVDAATFDTTRVIPRYNPITGKFEGIVALSSGVTSLTATGGLTATPNPITGVGTLSLQDAGIENIKLVTPYVTINTGAGLIGGGQVALGAALTLSVPSQGIIAAMLANTAVAPGHYTTADITVDAQGRLTFAQSGTVSGGSVNAITAGAGLAATPASPITNTGTLFVPNLGITLAMLATKTITLSAGTGLSGGGPVDLGNSVSLSLANTAVAPGQYANATVTVDQQGRLTFAAAGTVPITQLSPGTPGAPSGSSGLTFTPSPITGTGTLAVATGGITNAMLVNALLGITAGTGLIWSAGGGSMALGSTTNTLRLADTAVAAGPYTMPDVTIDAQGRVTAAVSNTASTFLAGAVILAPATSVRNVIQPTGDFVPLVAKQGASAGTAALTQWRAFDNTLLASVDATGNVLAPSVALAFDGAQVGKGVRFRDSGNTADLAWLHMFGGNELSLRLFAGASGFDVTNSANATVIRFLDSGLIGCGTASPGGRFHIVPTTASTRGFIVQDAAGQTTPPFQVWDENSVLLASLLRNRLRLYNLNDTLGADPGTNWERLEISPVANVWTFTTAASGAGTARPFQFSGGNVSFSNQIRLLSGANFIALQPPGLTVNTTYTLPATAGAAGQVLTTDGVGILSWSTVSASGGTGASVNLTYVTTAAESSLPNSSTLGNVISSGAHVSRPGFGLAGRVYTETDTQGGTPFLATGAAWLQMAAGVNATLSVNPGAGLTGGGSVALGSAISLAIGAGLVTNAMLANASMTLAATAGHLTFSPAGVANAVLGNTVTLSLATISGVAGTNYVNPTLSVDAQGRITVIASGSATSPWVRDSGVSGSEFIYPGTATDMLVLGQQTTAPTASMLFAKVTAAARLGLLLQGAVGQSGHFLELRNSANQNYSYFDSDGSLLVTNQGNAARNSCAVLEVASTTGGTLLARMTGVQAAAIGSKVASLLVWKTDSTPPRFEYWDGAAYQPLWNGAPAGTVTAITAGAGLTGGTITNSGTIAIANAGVTLAMLATSTLTLAGTAGQINVSGGGPLALGGTATFSLPNVGPGASGPFAAATLSIDAQGRVTAIAASTLGSATYVTTANETATLANSKTLGALHASGGIGSRPVSTVGTPGIAGRTYTATDQQGGTSFLDLGSSWLQMAAGVAATLTLSAGAGLTGGGPVALGSSVSLALPNVGPGAGGPFARASVSIDAFGRVTALTSGPAIDLASADVTGLLPLIRGGTGAGTAAGARANLLAAILGVNTDITAIQGLNVQNAIQIAPFGAGAGQTGEIRFMQLAAGGGTYVGFKGADAVPTSQIWQLPSASGAAGTVLTMNASNVLTWSLPTFTTTNALSSDTNSLLPGNLMLPDWDALVPSIPCKSRPLGGVEGSYLDTVFLNPFSDAVPNGSKIVAFATPPGVTSVTIAIPMKIPAGGAAGSVAFVAVLTPANATPGAPAANTSATFTLTSSLQTFTLTPTGLVANTEYRLQLRARDAGVTQNQIEAGPVTITVGSGATGVFAANFERYHVRPEDTWDNLYGDFLAAGGQGATCYRQSMGGRVVFETTATSLSVEVYPQVGTSSGGTLQQYVVLVNGRFYTVLNPVSPYTLQHLALTLPAGRKRVDLLVGVTGYSGQLFPCYVRALYWTKTDELRILAPPKTLRTLVIYGDEIAGGQGATYPSYTGWVGLLRQVYPATLMVEGRGSLSFFEDAATLSARITLARRIAAQNPTQIWLAIGTNDYGLSLSSSVTWSAAAFGTAYANFLDLLHLFAPEAAIYVQTPLSRTSETTVNTYGSTLPNYRTQITNATTSRPWTVLVDGTTLVTTADMGDGLHPTAAGHEKVAAAVLPVLATNPGAVTAGFATVVASATLAWPQATVSPHQIIPVDIPCSGVIAGDTGAVSLDSLVPGTLDANGFPITNSVEITQPTTSANTITCNVRNLSNLAITVPAGTLRGYAVRVS